MVYVPEVWGVELHCRFTDNNTTIYKVAKVFFMKLHFPPCFIQPLVVLFRQFQMDQEGDRRLANSPTPDGRRRYPTEHR
jgi:hypothetical protein